MNIENFIGGLNPKVTIQLGHLGSAFLQILDFPCHVGMCLHFLAFASNLGPLLNPIPT